MKYWDEMVTKYGFNDGEATPLEAEDSREIYIYVVNLLAKEMGLSERVEAYNRGGLHNNIMIVPRDNANWPERAIEIAQTLGLDAYIQIDVTQLKDELDDFLANNLDDILDEADDLTTL